MHEMSSEEGWVDIEQVAAHLRVNKESVYRWIEEKSFPAHRVGRLYRFKLSEVDGWVVSGGGEREANQSKNRAGRDDRKETGR
jgi:excisionase family DNA binding protein